MTLQPHKHISVASLALFLGGLLWVAAFWFPVFETADREIIGYWVFVSGWMGFVVLQFAWYANLLLLVAVILMYSAPVRATIFAAVGLLLATQAFWFDALPETTQSVAITAKGLGFWFWYAGIFLMSVGVFFCLDTDEVTEVVEETKEADIDKSPVAPAPVAAENPVVARMKTDLSSAKPASAPVVAAEEPVVEQVVAIDALDVVVAEAGEIGKAEEPAEVNEPEPFVLTKTDDELEVTIPALTSILHDAVFPDIKKPEQ